MIDGSEKRNRQLAFELQTSHVCEKPRVKSTVTTANNLIWNLLVLSFQTVYICKIPRPGGGFHSLALAHGIIRVTISPPGGQILPACNEVCWVSGAIKR